MRTNGTASDWELEGLKLIVEEKKKREREKERGGSGWSRDRRSSLLPTMQGRREIQQVGQVFP